MASPSASTALHRRRDKRRHLSSSAIDLRDPIEIVALAVRYDESRLDESLLLAPLEQGRLHDSSSQQFRSAFDFLQEMTQPLGTHHTTTTTTTTTKETLTEPDYALTPVILSGLIAAIQEEREKQSSSANQSNTIDETDLVAACQTMRRAALSRVRLHRRRLRIQRIALPLLSLSVLLVLYIRTLTDIRTLLNTLGFVDSCSTENEHYRHTCRMSEAILWEKYRDYLLTLGADCPDGVCRHAFFEGRHYDAPFTLHASLSRPLITMEELWDRPQRTAAEKLVWLGETAVNELVREAFEKYHAPNMGRRVLDVGCGVGGTLYALLTSKEHHAKSERPLYYHGISISTAEVHFSRRLVQVHALEEDSFDFEERNYDSEGLTPKGYSALVAVESLSSSPDLQSTLANLMPSLKKGGIMIIVDDVVSPGKSIAPGDLKTRPSLVEHNVWVEALEKAGCRVELARDLSLEYEVPDLSVQLGWDLFPYWLLRAPWELLFSSTSAPAHRMAELAKERQVMAAESVGRKSRFQNAQTAYHMYVCRKGK